MTQARTRPAAQTQGAGYIGKQEKLRYYSGLAGQNLVYAFIGGSFFTYFMTDIAMFPALAVSVLLIVMKAWDGVNDPIVGSIIDRHAFKNGEKLRPLLRYMPLPIGICTVLLFTVFSTAENLLWLRISCFIVMYLAWDVVYTVQDVAMWGITASVSPDGNERDRFVKWARTVGGCTFGVFSLGIPMALESLAKVTGSSMALMTFVFAVIFGLGGALLSYRASAARERVQVAPENRQSSVRESFSLLFRNRMMLLVTASNLCGALGFGGQLVTYFFKYKLPADFIGAGGFIGALGMTTIYAAVTGLPGFIGMLFADRLKKLFRTYVNALIFMQICNFTVRLIAYFIGYEGVSLWLGLGLIGIGCLPMGAASIAQTSIFCDSVDYMEWKTGKRTEGVVFSMQTFFTKVSSGITAGLAALSLHLMDYRQIGETSAVFVGTQSQAFETWIWPLVMLTPAVASLLSIVPLLFIRYTPEQRRQVERELAERREAVCVGIGNDE